MTAPRGVRVLTPARLRADAGWADPVDDRDLPSRRRRQRARARLRLRAGVAALVAVVLVALLYTAVAGAGFRPVDEVGGENPPESQPHEAAAPARPAEPLPEPAPWPSTLPVAAAIPAPPPMVREGALSPRSNKITLTGDAAALAGASGARTADPRPEPPIAPGTRLELAYPPGPPSIWLEAEDQERERVPVRDSDRASAGARVEFVGGDPPGELTARFTVPSAGDYVIWARVHARDTRRNSLLFSLDGDEEAVWHITPAGDEWTWDRANGREEDDGDPYIFPLEAGEHVLRLERREPGVILDGLLITGDLEYRP